MYKREDYWPYLAGVILFGGVVILPQLMKLNHVLREFDYLRRLSGGIAIAALFCWATNKSGQISYLKLISGFIFISLLVVAGGLQKDQEILIIIPGALAIISLFASGWTGIYVARMLGIDRRIKQINDIGEFKEEQKVQKKKYKQRLRFEEAKKSSGSGHEDNILMFLVKSYISWQEGALDQLNSETKQTISNMDPETIAYEMLKIDANLRVMQRFFASTEIDNDELLVDLCPSYVLTTKQWFMFINPKMSEHIVLPLCEISRYTRTESWKEDTGLIRLNDGRDIRFKTRGSPLPTTVKRLQEILNCNSTIEVTEE